MQLGLSRISRATMESDLQQQHHMIPDLHQRNQARMNSGLTRYRSAPSSYFTSFLDREFCNQFFDRASSPETERIFTRFMNSGAVAGAAVEDPFARSVSPVRQNSLVKEEINQQSQMASSMTDEAMIIQQQQLQSNISGYALSPKGLYRSSSKPPLPHTSLSSAMEASHSVGQARLPRMNTGLVNSSNLIRHNSSPTGLFPQINIGDGYIAIRDGGNFGAGNDTKEASFATSTGLKSSMNYSSGLMPPLAEIGVKSNEVNSLDSEGFWDESAIMSENIGGLKRFREDKEQELSGLNSSAEPQNDAGSRPPPLSHHLSLPKTPADFAGVEKFLQSSDSVPCRIRAKRGFATHPRSIAERVRRTKISERIRKLQDLVPNMDRQTNTADMLDLAADYIKDLQRQVQMLNDTRAKCTCLNKQQQL